MGVIIGGRVPVANRVRVKEEKKLSKRIKELDRNKTEKKKGKVRAWLKKLSPSNNK